MDDEIKAPEAATGETPAPAPAPNPEIDKNPEVLAEEIKSRIWHIRIERWKEMAKGFAFFLQTFKAEAVSLMSGLGTLVVGWFQLKKWVIQGRHDTKAMAQQEFGLTKSKTSRKNMSSSEGQGYGSGSGRLGAKHQEPVGMAPPPPPGGELMPSPNSGIEGRLQTVFTDPMNYVPILTALVFVWSSWKAWLKRKAKQTEGGKV